MSAMERARKYAGVFIAAGDRWPFFVPIDATVTRTPDSDTVVVQGVVMERSDGGWRLTEGDECWVVRKAVPA